MRIVAAFLAVALTSCGYHVAGHSDVLPKTIKTVCIPPFANVTIRYKLTDRLAEELAKEFIARTRYRVVSDPNTADMVLRGAVLGYFSTPTIFDPVTSRASAVDVYVRMSVSVVERATGKTLFNRPSFESRERYEISSDARAYFEESDAGLNRVSKQVAQQLVTSILENF
jgi:Lipopolysaccharide-assembly